MEIIFTSAESIAVGDMRLIGRTSLLMFPIYGLGALLGPICRRLDMWIGDAERLGRKDKVWRHGTNSMVLIFLAEYLSGTFLKLYGICPWDYTGRHSNINGLIRLDFAPLWFCTGLLFEGITKW